MSQLNPQYKRRETYIYCLIWTLAFFLSAVEGFFHQEQFAEPDYDWRHLSYILRLNCVFLVVFIFHNCLLVPLLVKRRQWLYALLFLSLVFVTPFTIKGLIGKEEPPKEISALFNERDEGPRDFKLPQPPGRKPFKPPYPPFGASDVVLGIIAALVMGLNLGVKFYLKSEQKTKEMELLRRRALEDQLRYLKYQINPHFFMNTLNNIHALVDINPERSKKAIRRLSDMMRYILYEGNNDMVALQKEVVLIKSYTGLMKMRYSKRVSISLNLQDNLPNATLPPLLLICFVENAFKHGVSYDQPSFIKVSLRTGLQKIIFTCHNSLPGQSQSGSESQDRGGVGLANARRRLDLIYGNDYTLDIVTGENDFFVQLTLPIQHDAPQTSTTKTT
ncbi:MAG: sensor histidine kinase [Alloprevotella sp.]